MTRTIIAGNWKMHRGPQGTKAFFRDFRIDAGNGHPEVVVFPPTISLPMARDALGSGSGIELGIQNVHWEEEGAFTGEVSAVMAMDCDVRYALVGHSERRHLFGETDAMVGRKVKSVWNAGLHAMACVGETLEQREGGELDDVLLRQLDAVLRGLADSGPSDRWSRQLVIAYEPVWAIGTGRTATPDDAAHAHGFLRARLVEELGEKTAMEIPILYGGSVKPSNAEELLAASDVDGVLVGGASLDPDSFRKIVEAAGSASAAG